MAKLSIAVFVAVFLDVHASVLHAQGGGLTVRIGGVELPSGRVLSIVVDSDTENPDAALIALPPDTARSNDYGRGIDIATIDGQPLFNGEIVEVAASVDRSGRAIAMVRALNRLHRLARGKQTRTFDGISDAELARRLALEAGLQAETSGMESLIQHDHVYQHNQTDLEFLLERAARIGYEVFADETTVHFQKRRTVLPTTVGCRPDVALLKSFLVKLSSAGSVAEVTVRGWDFVAKKEITGRARQGVIALSAAASDADPRPSTVDLGFVETLQSGAAAHATAAGALSAITARNLSAEMNVEGIAALRAGRSVVLQGAGSAFDGEYYVTQTSHRLGQGSSDGWHTLLRLVRADRALFVLPEVGDEVLVAFQHGDVARPIVVGSLWNGKAPPRESSPCGPRRN
jgi:Bacteriophage probable baseplate hub protein